MGERMKCRWDTMADGSAHLNMTCDRSCTHDQPCLSSVLSRGERELTPRDVLDHKSIWEPGYEHQRHPTNLRSPTATPPAEARALARIAAKGTQLWFQGYRSEPDSVVIAKFVWSARDDQLARASDTPGQGVAFDQEVSDLRPVGTAAKGPGCDDDVAERG